MPQRVIYPQWRDQWEATPYPFSDSASLTNDAGDFILNGTFIDAHIYPVGGLAGLYLSSIDVDNQNVTFNIGDSAEPVRCSGSFPVTSPLDYISLTDRYGRPAGILISERKRLAVFQTWGVGLHVFTASQTSFAATCCMPTPAIGVRGIVLEDGTVVSGSVWLVGGEGVVLSQEDVNIRVKCEDLTTPTIRIDIVGDPLRRRDMCEAEPSFTTPNPVRTLRIRSDAGWFDCQPDEFGNYSISANNTLVDDSVLRIRTTERGIVFEAVGSTITGNAST